MISNERIEELMSAYVFGILEGEDLKEAEDYIKNNPDAYRLYEEAFTQLVFSLKQESPGHDLKQRLMDEIRPASKTIEAGHEPVIWDRFKPFLMGFATATATAVIIGIITFNHFVDTRNTGTDKLIASYEQKLEERDQELANIEEELAQVKLETEEQAEMLAFLENPDVVIINLVNTEEDITAVGRVLWNQKDEDAIFYGLNLPEAPEGKTYQLWAIADGKPKSAGTFNVDDKGNQAMVIHSLKDIGDISNFAVSLEPAGGVPSPTGKIYLMGGDT